MLSRTQAGPGRTVKQEQEEISRNQVQTFIYLYVAEPRSVQQQHSCAEKKDVNGLLLFVTDGFTFFQHEKNATFMVVECTFYSQKIGKLALEAVFSLYDETI